jgi:hypothetical protein
MYPTPEQIAVAAYYRWRRRGSDHGRDQEDWDAALKDLTFGLNYRWTVRHALRAGAGDGARQASPGQQQTEAGGFARHCRFCERSAPAVSFEAGPWALLPSLGSTSLLAWEECDECRAHFDAHLADPFEAFVRPLMGAEPALPDPALGVPVLALKALVRLGLSIVPALEIHHFGDTLEWVNNPDAERDTALLLGLGCHVYVTPTPVPAPFASLARRSDDSVAMPYMLFFLGTNRLVLQTSLPFCPRDEDLDDRPDDLRGPTLSMSLGSGRDHRPSRVVFLPVVAPLPASPVEAFPARETSRHAGVGEPPLRR